MVLALPKPNIEFKTKQLLNADFLKSHLFILFIYLLRLYSTSAEGL